MVFKIAIIEPDEMSESDKFVIDIPKLVTYFDQY